MYVKWKLVLVHLETVLVSAQDRCTVCSECTIGLEIIFFLNTAWKSFWMHLMELLGDVGQVDAHFGLFGDSVNLGTKLVQGLRRTYHRLGNHFGRKQWYSYRTWVKWKLVSVHLEIVLISTKIGTWFVPNIP
jgi:hypothetical protein